MEKVNKEKRGSLFYYIIALLFFLAFVIGSVIACNAEKAEAAETTGGVYYPDLLKEVDFGTYEAQVRNICDAYPCIAVGVLNTNPNYFKYYFFAESASKELRYYASWGNCGIHTATYCVTVRDGSVIYIEHNAENRIQATFNHIGGKCDTELVGTNFDLVYSSECSKNTGYESVYNQISAKTNNLVHPKDYVKTEYNASAPYLEFKSLIVDNLMSKGTVTSVKDASHLYSEFFSPSYWQIIYYLRNRSELDISYELKIKFEVELPTLAYIQRLYDNFGYNFDSERTILWKNKELIDYWNKDSAADSRTFVVEYNLEITPNTYDIVTYQLSFSQWEYLLRATNAELNTELSGYNARERSTLLSFLHVKKITTEVLTARSDSVVYGGFTSNLFERGVYDSCVNVYTKVDKNFVTEDLLEDAIYDDVRAAEKEYLEELKQQVNDLQNQVNNANGSLGVYDNMYEGENLWTAIKSAGTGILGLMSTLAFIPRALGSIFVFFPKEIQDFMGYVLILSCAFVVWRLFKGK